MYPVVPATCFTPQDCVHAITRRAYALCLCPILTTDVCPSAPYPCPDALSLPLLSPDRTTPRPQPQLAATQPCPLLLAR